MAGHTLNSALAAYTRTKRKGKTEGAHPKLPSSFQAAAGVQVPVPVQNSKKPRCSRAFCCFYGIIGVVSVNRYS